MAIRTLAEFQKNSIELVRVTLRDCRGARYVDLRIWEAERPGEPGGEAETSKGFSLSQELIPALIGALDQSYNEILRGHDDPDKNLTKGGDKH